MEARGRGTGTHPLQIEGTFSELTAALGPGRDKLLIQVILCGSHPYLVGRSWSCCLVDTRRYAMEFVCERRLPADAMVELWLDRRELPARLRFYGFVLGAMHTEDGRHRVRVLHEDAAAIDDRASREA